MSAMRILPVESVENQFCVRMGEGLVRPLRFKDGGPLPLDPGWRPTRLLIGPSEIFVLQLRHTDGQASTWFMDESLSFVANEFSQLPDRARSAMIDLIATLPSVASVSDRISSITLDGIQLFQSISDERLHSLTEFWKNNDYLLIADALTPAAIDLLNERIRYGQNDAGELQFHRIHNEGDSHHFINQFLGASVEYYKLVLAKDLLATYGFAMKYVKNSNLHPHYDNYNNPISSTICYHSAPSDVRIPIYLDRARFSNPYPLRLTVKDRDGIPRANVVSLDLRPGDIGIFRGRNHLHWRDAIADEVDYRAVLLHFSDYKYKGTMTAGSGSIQYIANAAYVTYDSYDEFRRAYMMYFEHVEPGSV
jgi:hypothetical protein